MFCQFKFISIDPIWYLKDICLDGCLHSLLVHGYFKPIFFNVVLQWMNLVNYFVST